METARWDRMKALFEQALALPPQERAAFLDEACAEDPALRDEIASLVAASEDASSFFDRMDEKVVGKLAEDMLGSRLPDDDLDDLIGVSVRHYQVGERLGGGGMGVVYRATDTRLGRSVALKFLPPHLRTSDEAKARFIHEAKAASALDHPNIATIHEIGETDDGKLFIAMTYYRGKTLKKKIADGPLPLDKALNYAAQVARGLSKAHTQDIIHRDVKPANVMVTEDGLVKVVDFGLAKIADVQLTRTGTTLGTISYMSPEQARGEGVDHRTDVWSLGVVLYEMLTGERPFKGDFPEAVLYSVLNEAPKPLTEANPGVPADLEHVVMLCLEKDPALRYATMDDLLADLEVWTKEAAAPPSRARTVVIAGLSVLATVLVLMAAWALKNASGPSQKHLAVLSAISADSASQVFTNGLVETLTRKLIQFQDRSLWVESSAEVQKNAITNSTEAFEKFGVNLALIVGTERRDDSIRVTLDLVDALSQQSQKHIEIIRPTAVRTALTYELVATLADMLDIELTPTMRSVLTAGSTTAPEAEHFYTLGLGSLQRYQETDNIDIAIGLFEQAIRNDSSYALAYAGLGEAYWRKFEATKEMKWAEQAERHCERALRLEDLISPTVYVTLGFIYYGKGLPGFAKGAFELALAKEPTNATAYIGLAKTFEALYRVEDAEGAYRRAIELKPDYWASWNALGVFYHNQSRFEDAIEPFQQMITLTPLNARGYRNLSAMYFYLDRKEDSRTKAKEALEVEPDYQGFFNLANMYFYDREYKLAALYYREALNFPNADYKVWGALAEAYYWTPNKRDSAYDAYEHAAALAQERLRFNPLDQDIYPNLAGYYAMLEDSSRALSLLQDVGAMEPEEGEVLFQIGVVYEQLDKRDLALKWLEKAIDKGYSLVEIDHFPGLGKLRSDGRFQRMLENQRRNDGI